MEVPQSPDVLTKYQDFKGEFSDYVRFDDEQEVRSIARQAFLNDEEYVPHYHYPRLEKFHDEEMSVTKKTGIQEIVRELEVAKSQPGANVAEISLYQSFYETRLKRILLVEAARNLQTNLSTSGLETRRRSFLELNESLYGEIDRAAYLGMLGTEAHRADTLVPKNAQATQIQQELQTFFGHIDTEGHIEPEIMDASVFEQLHDYVKERYKDVLAVVPTTDENVRYDAESSAEIMRQALTVGGFADEGWRVVINSKRTNPVSNEATKEIMLPTSTNRTASELRRLIIHEQEAHTRRAQNGAKSGIKMLAVGTANYTDIEEGLGIILECAIDGSLDNPAFDRARYRYITAGLAMGTDGTPRDGRETYEALWRIIALDTHQDGFITDQTIMHAKSEAYKHVENAFRSTPFWMKGVIFTKLKIYYEGLLRNAEYLSERIDNLDDAFDEIFIGKYDHTDEQERRQVKSLLHRIG